MFLYFDCPELYFYENKPSLEGLYVLGKICKEKQSTTSKSLTIGRLSRYLFNLGSGLIKYGIYGEGVKCFEDTLKVINDNPSEFLREGGYLHPFEISNTRFAEREFNVQVKLTETRLSPERLLRHDNLPDGFFPIFSTLAYFYLRTKQLDRLEEMIKNNIFVKRSEDLQDMLQNIERAEDYSEDDIKLRNDPAFSDIAGTSRECLRFLEKIKKVARTEHPVLITGPSGSGKELVAKAIYKLRGKGELKSINCGAMPTELIENELFGSEKGAFAGATAVHKGYCEEVGEGILFLDEIHSADEKLQKKLLRLIGENEFYRLGDTKKRNFKGRIITATNEDILKLIEAGAFKGDLYKRINRLIIDMPLLSLKPPDDIKEIILFLMKKYAPNRKISVEAIDAICDYSISKHNNDVRELETIIIRLDTFLRSSTIRVNDLPSECRNEFQEDDDSQTYYDIPVHAGQKERYENEDLRKALELTNGNQSQVAVLFRCSASAISQRIDKLEKLGLNPTKIEDSHKGNDTT